MNSSSCKAGTNWVLALRPVQDQTCPRYHTDCLERIRIVQDAYERRGMNLMITALGEGWSTERIGCAIAQLVQDQRKALAPYETALQEDELRERERGRESRRNSIDWDSDAAEIAAMDEESDSEDDAGPAAKPTAEQLRIFTAALEDSNAFEYSSGDESDDYI